MRLIYKITIPVLVVLGGLMVLVAFVFSSSLQNGMVQQEFLRVQDAVAKAQNQLLNADNFVNPTSTETQAEFHSFFEVVTDPSIARLTIWNTHQMAIFSDLPQLIGTHRAGVTDVEDALTSEQPFYIVKTEDSGSPVQTDIPNFIDIFIPLRFAGKVVGVAEVRTVIGAILKPIEQQTYNIALSLAGAAILIFVAVLLTFRLFVTGPLSALKEMSSKVIKGDLAARARVRTTDEMGEVTQFINTMLTRVEKTQEDLQSANTTITKQKEGVEEEVRVRTRELTEEKARLIASLNSLSLGFLLMTREDVLLYANPAITRILGVPQGAAKITDIDKILLGSFDFAAARKKAIETREFIEMKEVAYETRFLRVIVAPILVKGNDNAIGVIVVFEDITEAKLLDYAKTSFVAIASHELRTPLTIIRGNAELILDDIKGKDMGDLPNRVKSIYEGSIRLLNIVNDFLDVTALEEKHVQFKEDRFDVVELADAIAKDMHDKAGKKNLKLEVVQPESAMPYVLADRERTKEVFVNLISNAIQYTDKGSITITFAVKDAFVVALVKDTGVGIPAEKQITLFKKFNTIQDKFLRSREYGSGMGLYISKLIMDSMNGKVTLEESKVGDGTTFSASFPVAV